jgi:hypothetical protein
MASRPEDTNCKRCRAALDRERLADDMAANTASLRADMERAATEAAEPYPAPPGMFWTWYRGGWELRSPSDQ